MSVLRLSSSVRTLHAPSCPHDHPRPHLPLLPAACRHARAGHRCRARRRSQTQAVTIDHDPKRFRKTVVAWRKSEIRIPSHGSLARLHPLLNSATSGCLDAEVVFTSADSRRSQIAAVCPTDCRKNRRQLTAVFLTAAASSRSFRTAPLLSHLVAAAQISAMETSARRPERSPSLSLASLSWAGRTRASPEMPAVPHHQLSKDGSSCAQRSTHYVAA